MWTLINFSVCFFRCYPSPLYHYNIKPFIWGAFIFGSSCLQRCQTSMILRFILGFAWCLLHLLFSIVHIGSHLYQVIACYIISSGFLKRYRMLQLHKLQHLAVVVDSKEAIKTTQIKQLLRWLSDIGVKSLILYDMEGKQTCTSLKYEFNERLC